MIQACDEDDRKFLWKKYGFDSADFIKVQKLFNAGFSIMKAAKIVAEKKTQPKGTEEIMERNIALSIKEAWNKQADEYNQWDNLSVDEAVEFTIQYMTIMARQAFEDTRKEKKQE